MATLAQLKSQLSITALELEKSLDASGQFSGWYRMWIDDRRIAISIHQDLAKELQSNPDIKSLGLQHTVRPAEKGDYDSYRIIKYNSNPDIIL